MFLIRLIKKYLSIVLKKKGVIFVCKNLKCLFLRINFENSIPTLKSEKIKGKIGYKSIFCYSYSIGFPQQKVDMIFLRNKKQRGCILTL